MICVFHDECPVLVLNYGSNWYFKFKHVARSVHLPLKKVSKRVPHEHVVRFTDIVRRHVSCTEKCYPTTQFLTLKGLHYVGLVANSFMRDRLITFAQTICRCSSTFDFNHNTSDEHTRKEYAEPPIENKGDYICRFGVVPKYNIRFVQLPHKWYVHATDLLAAIKRSAYMITKHVGDRNQVSWRALHRYAEEKYRCVVSVDRWRHNTLLLKPEGVKQLMFAAGAGRTYYEIRQGVQDYDYEHPTQYVVPNNMSVRKASRRKILYADKCVVGVLYQRIYFIVLPENTAWYKLTQLLSHFNVVMSRDEEQTLRDDNNLVTWEAVCGALSTVGLRTNIRWRPNTQMINDVGVHILLTKRNKHAEAEDIVLRQKHLTLYQAQK